MANRQTPTPKKLSIDVGHSSGPPTKIGVPASISPGNMNSNSKKISY